MNTKKLLALALVLVMVLCALPVVYAIEGDTAQGGNGDITTDIDDYLPGDEDVLIGDVDNNGVINKNDAIYIMWNIAGKADLPNEAAADYDKDGKITSNDEIYILWHIAGKLA